MTEVDNAIMENGGLERVGGASGRSEQQKRNRSGEVWAVRMIVVRA